MTPAWTGAAQWRVLSVGDSESSQFLRLWQVWRADPQRPRMLHVVAVCSTPFTNTPHAIGLAPLAEQLDAQLWGLLPGFHRLVFEAGQVLLTLCLGDVQTLLKQQHFQADSVLFNPSELPRAGMVHTVKAMARLCRRGSTFETLQTNDTLVAALKQCGFIASAADGLQASYNPGWRTKPSAQTVQPTSCVVVGAGLAGAAVAGSLARRGWAVTVLDAASKPASGASSLPAGLLVPHTSPDDNALSRLSRCGVRMTLQQARAVLRHGTDWAHTGVLQRYLGGTAAKLPPAWAQDPATAASDWCSSPSPKTLAAAGLPQGTAALWHSAAGWVKPAALVRAWLRSPTSSLPGITLPDTALPGITWRGDSRVAQFMPLGSAWQVLDAAGQLLASSDVVVIAAGFASQALAAAAGAAPPDLQAVRGQVMFGLQPEPAVQQSLPPPALLPPFPVNGHGGLIPAINSPDGPLWLMGASYERDVTHASITADDHAENRARLQALLPTAAIALARQSAAPHVRAWAGVRCATPNRLPLVKPLETPGIWLCTGMGSRGLSFAVLCAELLAAQLHAEPLPVELQLAKALIRTSR